MPISRDVKLGRRVQIHNPDLVNLYEPAILEIARKSNNKNWVIGSVSDLRTEQLAQVQARYHGIKVTTDYRELFGDRDVDSVVMPPHCYSF